MKRQLLRVFEYETLRYPSERNGIVFTEAHFNALVLFNERHQNRYFTVVHQGIRFSHYVGVLQVGSLTLEVLPKADREEPTEENRARWQSVLVAMLRECNLLQAEPLDQAFLLVQAGPLLEIYLEAFLTEIENLLRRGLVAQYRQTEGNAATLKGSLQFSRHLQYNLVHQERFYVRHQTYDNQRLLHQVLFQALQRLPDLTPHGQLLNQARRLASLFPPQPYLLVTARTFDDLSLDRRTQPYRTALALARLLLLHYQPSMRAGEDHVLAILFDMNALFEEYIYRQLKKVESESVSIERQVPVDFWAHKRVRTDVLIRHLDTDTNYIVDTKWKILSQSQPDDDDLKQMYVYNQYYQATKSVLLYPYVTGAESVYGVFHQPILSLGQHSDQRTHGCEVCFVRVEEGGQLRKNMCELLLRSILSVPVCQQPD